MGFLLRYGTCLLCAANLYSSSTKHTTPLPPVHPSLFSAQPPIHLPSPSQQAKHLNPPFFSSHVNLTPIPQPEATVPWRSWLARGANISYVTPRSRVQPSLEPLSLLRSIFSTFCPCCVLRSPFWEVCGDMEMCLVCTTALSGNTGNCTVGQLSEY